MKHAELAARLDAAADRLTTKVLTEMYADPFWHARFGERADLQGKQDGRLHIDHLIQALHAADPAIIENYARRLQQVLTSRGMCTRHLDDNFRLLAAAITDEDWADGAVATDLLAIARVALHHGDAHARDLQRLTPSLAGAVADELYAQQAAVDPDERRYLTDDLVGYAADAIALGQPAVFGQHVAWLAGFLATRRTPRDRLDQALRALTTAALTIAPGAAEQLHAVVDPAIAALAAPSAT